MKRKIIVQHVWYLILNKKHTSILAPTYMCIYAYTYNIHKKIGKHIQYLV